MDRRNLVDIANVCFSYRQKKVFDNLEFQLRRGQICGLLGLNGSGKSTLLYLISGLLLPQKGSVKVFDEDMTARPARVLERIYIVPEEFELPSVSLKKYVDTYSVFYPNFSLDLFNKCLTQFALPTSIDNIGALSMGQKKKIKLSFALATRAELLLMDEPTNGLDIPSKSAFRKAVASAITEKQTLLISTHQIRDIDTMLDHILILDNSKVLLNSSCVELSKRYATRNLAAGSEMPEGVLYTMPTAIGVMALYERHDEDDGAMVSDLNIEMLFNAIIEKSVKF